MSKLLKKFKFAFDKSSGAGYLSIREGQHSKTEIISSKTIKKDSLIIDTDKNGEILGIEVLIGTNLK